MHPRSRIDDFLMKLSKIQIIIVVVLAVIIACTGILNYQASLLYGNNGGKIVIFGKLSLIARLSFGIALIAFIKNQKYMVPVIVALMLCSLVIGWWFTLGSAVFMIKNYWYIVFAALVTTGFYLWNKRSA